MSRAEGTVRVMQAPTLASVPTITAIRAVPDADPALASFMAERPADDRPDLVGRAVRIGLLALQDAGVTVNVDVVRGEFEKLVRQTESVNEKAALALEQTLRLNFAD